MKIVSSEAMARIDSRAQAEFAFPSLVLMEDAGVKAWAAFRQAGPGPGGGRRGGWSSSPAGATMAVTPLSWPARRPWRSSEPLTIVLAGGRPEKDSDPGRNLAACEALGMEIIDWPVQRDLVTTRIAEASWIIDGIAGTGIRGALRPPLVGHRGVHEPEPGEKGRT